MRCSMGQLLLQASNYRDYKIALLRWSLELITQRLQKTYSNNSTGASLKTEDAYIRLYLCISSKDVNVNLIRHMDRHQHNTRCKEDFILPKTEQLKRTFRYLAAQIWNSLPVDIRKSETRNAFERAYVNTNYGSFSMNYFRKRQPLKRAFRFTLRSYRPASFEMSFSFNFYH